MVPKVAKKNLVSKKAGRSSAKYQSVRTGREGETRKQKIGKERGSNKSDALGVSGSRIKEPRCGND